jgi:malonate-semialdehyde dehydrogenase (acetylating)/methylmalonate-semialdehyde dehydrogenase
MESGLPEGVFNIVHGDRQAVDALLAHPLVRAVSFVGSTAAARHVYETGTRQGKRVQAAGGAKNHLIVMPDADLDQAAAAIGVSAFGCAGERCMAGSVAVALGSAADPLVERLARNASRLKVAPTDDGGEVDMGPVITREHRDRVAGYLDVARDEGADVVLDGRSIAAAEGPGYLIGPSLLDRVEPAMRVAREEIFGPVLSVIRADDLDQALAIGRACPYGNGASIFTRSGAAARRFKQQFNAGMIGINVGVPAPMAWFPFTGWNQSFFGDLHIQGTEAIQFYTNQKVTMSRWFEPGPAQPGPDPIWRGGRP